MAALLVAPLLCLGAAGCDLNWPGTDPDASYRFVDSWTIACDCTGVQIGTGVVVDRHRTTRSMCSDALPDTFRAGGACAELAGELRTHAVAYTCEHVRPPAPTRDAVSTCPLRTRDDGSSSSPLTSGGVDSRWQALGWPNPRADFQGELMSSDALLSIHYLRWRDARPDLTGQIYFTGGRCEGSTCEVTLDGLDLWADDFQINRPFPARDTRVRDANIRNLSRWVGVRLPDGSVEFADADLVITGRIDGAMERMVVDAPEPIRGRFERDHDGQSFFVLEGALRGSDVRIELTARFLQVGGAPTAVVTSSSTCSGGTCLHTHSALGSRTFDGQAVRSYRWYGADRRLLGVAGTFRSRADTPYPLTLTVEDAAGRIATREVQRPRVLPPPRELPPPPPFR